MITYFEIELHILYVLNIHIKFLVNQILFTIQFINIFVIHNFRIQNFLFKHLIDNIIIDLTKIS